MFKVAGVHSQYVAVSAGTIQRDGYSDDSRLPSFLDHPKRADHARRYWFLNHSS
jgi:hypothetical protein